MPYVSKCFGEFGVLVSEERVRARHKTYIDRLSASLDRGVAKLNEHNRIREAYDAALAMDSLVRIQREELQRHVDAGWRVDSGGVYRGSVDFDNVRDKGHLLMVNEVGYELQGFKTLVENNIATVERTVTEQIEQERGKVLTRTALAALGLAVGAFMLFWLLRFVRKYLGHAKEKARQLKDAASGKVDKLQAANQRRKVRSVMMDETIREMTRTALSGADKQSKEVLIAELRKAIESGNHELANALETALKKA